MILWPVERLILRLTLTLAVLCVALMWLKGTVLGSSEYLFSMLCAVGLAFIGQVYRRLGRSENIALMTHAAALFLGFSAAASLYNILLLPLSHAPIDPLLVRMDMWLGYSWPAFCAWVAQFPPLVTPLRIVYMSTLLQLLFVILFLGAVGDRRMLHRSALALVIAGIVTICVWSVFPSLGASAYWLLDPKVDAIVRPVVSSAYGSHLTQILHSGVGNIATMNINGLIGFPSFHTVMALTTLLAIWPYRWVRAVFLPLTALLLPAILVDGGHNLVDVLGGVFVLAFSWRLAMWVERGLAGKDAEAPALWFPIFGRAKPDRSRVIPG
ncbi:MAG TPA: phosphatase PAP2 family protein [Rhizobiaceae bacterium]|nr:phosphatase PAP2 family protein [Rhizobiaceae bacterium]